MSDVITVSFEDVANRWMAYSEELEKERDELRAHLAEKDAQIEALMNGGETLVDGMVAIGAGRFEQLRKAESHLADAVAFVRKAGHLPGCEAPRCQYKEKQPGDYWLCCPRHEELHYGGQLSGHDFQPGPCTCGHDRIVGSEGE